MGRTFFAIPGLLALATLVACGETSGGGTGTPSDRNFVLLSIDTLRADRLGAYGNDDWAPRTPSPAMDAFAAGGVLFETTYAARGQTHPSIATLLTGKYPVTNGVGENGQSLDARHTTLFERLQSAGYQTGVFIANFEVEHPVEGWVARGADVRGDGFEGRRNIEARMESRFQSQWDDRVEAAASRYLDEVDASRPFALWAHFYDAHKPYNPQAEDITRFGAADGVPTPLVAPGPDSGMDLERHLSLITLGQRPIPALELQRILGLYDAGVTGVDRRIARLLGRLEDMGELASTYVFITSDHGEELFDHNRYFFHGSSIYNGTVRVPLMVAGPDLPKGRRVSAHVQLLDVAPTVLDLLGLPSDPEIEGRSLVPLLRGETEEPPAPYAFMEWQDLVWAVSDGKHKLIFNPQGTRPRKAPFHMLPEGQGFQIACLEGYDLRTDPGETENLLADFPVTAVSTPEQLPEAFRGHVAALRAFMADPRHKDTRFKDLVFDAEDIDRMAQIGYVAGGLENGKRRDSAQVGCP